MAAARVSRSAAVANRCDLQTYLDRAKWSLALALPAISYDHYYGDSALNLLIAGAICTRVRVEFGLPISGGLVTD